MKDETGGEIMTDIGSETLSYLTDDDNNENEKKQNSQKVCHKMIFKKCSKCSLQKKIFWQISINM